MKAQKKYPYFKILSIITLLFFSVFSCSEVNEIKEVESASKKKKISVAASSLQRITTMQDALLTISNVYATSVISGNLAEYSYDNDINTHWSSNTNSGQFIRYDLGSIKKVYRIEIAWFDGDNRTSYFKIKAGTNTSILPTIPIGGSTSTLSSSGTTDQLESYVLDTPVDAQYIRIQGYGNSKNNLNRISEIKIWSKTEVVINDHEVKLPVNNVYASSYLGNDIPNNTIDNNLNTRWNANGLNEFIRYDLGAVKKVFRVKIAWYNAGNRHSYFKVKAGITSDVNQMTTVFDAHDANSIPAGSSGNDTNPRELEVYEFSVPVNARYILIEGYGNSINNYNRIYETEIWSDYADVDFNHWKITLPVDNDSNGKPDEYQPSSLINQNYSSITNLNPFMYDDNTDGSITFYTYPAGATTGNSSYPRTELREQLTPGNNYNNWTISDGGILEAELKVESVSDDISNQYDKNIVIVGQIHGLISQADMATYGFSSNHAPPLLKMKWIDGDLKVYKKNLVNNSTSGIDLYDDSNSTWSDVSYNFGYVGYDKFSMKIEVEAWKITVTVQGGESNLNESYVFEDTTVNQSIQKWPFENYFKAGNYLAATDSNAFSRVKFYTLNISH